MAANGNANGSGIFGLGKIFGRAPRRSPSNMDLNTTPTPEPRPARFAEHAFEPPAPLPPPRPKPVPRVEPQEYNWFDVRHTDPEHLDDRGEGPSRGVRWEHPSTPRASTPPPSRTPTRVPPSLVQQISEIEDNDHLDPQYGGDLLRTSPPPHEMDPDASPSVRVTISPFLPRSDSFDFDPIGLELIDGGPSIKFCRGERTTALPALFKHGKVKFGSRVITRKSHAQIWCEKHKIFIQDTGSSAGTWLNDERLVYAGNSVSPPYQLNEGDVIKLGSDFSNAPRGDRMFKCVMIKVRFEYIAMDISFNCAPHCECLWRSVIHRKNIYSLNLPVKGANVIFSAIREWMRQYSNDTGHWNGWTESDAEIVMSVIERIIAVKRPSQADLLMCQSWIRKIARQTSALPNSFVLRGVKKTSEHPVFGGGFADIFKGLHSGNPVALKVLRVFVTEENQKKIHREVAQEALFWKHLTHPHILPFLGVTHDVFTPRLSLVSPWMPNGNILNYIEKHARADKLALLAQCAQGLLYLHTHNPGLVHGDVKGANILIDGEGHACLADFGLLTISESQSFATTVTGQNDRGSTRWMAPELFNAGVKKTRASDAYAFGMTILEIFTGCAPFQAYHHDIGVVMAVSRGERPARPDCKMHEELWTLATRCWIGDADARPSMQAIATDLDSQLARREMGQLTLSHPERGASIGSIAASITGSETDASSSSSSMNMSRLSIDTQFTLKP